METYFGTRMGKYRVLDALATLAFAYPPRAKFFSGELEQFLLLTRDMGLDPLTVKGSYAGAMGAPQFMPSNYRRYAVDAVEDGFEVIILSDRALDSEHAAIPSILAASAVHHHRTLDKTLNNQLVQ